ncbi:hypothetical protein [Fulvivirga ligni]|uniref:hypothetical protein n=1 Tax=Fulvivirga ligni TaxID=2904246 RepID=UPI001F2DD459|nr:hypothetical protein [Fulvivirga ligni]UII19823.1 hypothetical protein LVD16_18435 [Fulvivirga ligni]
MKITLQIMAALLLSVGCNRPQETADRESLQIEKINKSDLVGQWENKSSDSNNKIAAIYLKEDGKAFITYSDDRQFEGTWDSRFVKPVGVVDVTSDLLINFKETDAQLMKLLLALKEKENVYYLSGNDIFLEKQ